MSGAGAKAESGSHEAARRPDARRGHGRGRRPDRRAAAAASPVARAGPRRLVRDMGAEHPRHRLERPAGPDRRRLHGPAAESRDRRQFRRRLRPHRRPMGRRARDRRHPYAGRARRRGRRPRDGADDHGGAPPAAGRALSARRRMAEGRLSRSPRRSAAAPWGFSASGGSARRSPRGRKSFGLEVVYHGRRAPARRRLSLLSRRSPTWRRPATS